MKHLTELLDQPAHTPGLVVVLTTNGTGVAELLAECLMDDRFSFIAGYSRRVPAYEAWNILRRRRVVDIKVLFEENRLMRAPSCFQLAEILGRTDKASMPLFITDFLFTFTDEDIWLEDRYQVFQRCLRRAKALAQVRRVNLIVRDGEGKDFGKFFPELEWVADQVLKIETERRKAVQLGLM
ncbi:MAG: hypothetical protein JNM55_20930 [Anaerolineales bacterium]|nr:hypothetical protein [Anaerolineales bacterium]